MADPVESFHFPVSIDRERGELKKETVYERYIAGLIKQVLLTAPGERVNRPDFGAGLRRMVFAPNSDETATLLQTTIFQNLDKWLGTFIRVDDVLTRANESTLEVDIVYTLKARGEQRVLNLEVTL